MIFVKSVIKKYSSDDKVDKMKERLSLHLQDKQYRDMLSKYHFAESDLGQLRQVGALVEEAAEPVMYYGMFGQGKEVGEEQYDTLGKECLAVIVTLGGGVDELQSRYTRRERLTESYMIECIGMELLRVAYEQAAERIHAHTGKWISKFDFVGDKVPFDCMEEIFKRLSPEEISYNQAYMLTPKKTVVFLTDLCEERKESYCHVCADCSHAACPDRVTGVEYDTEELRTGCDIVEADAEFHDIGTKRNFTYGYQQIFGSRR